MSRELRLVGIATLEDVLRRGYEILEVIVQDEYTHDVVCSTRDGFVVFDTT